MRTYLQMICMLLAARLPRLLPTRLARWIWTRKSKVGTVLTWPDKVGVDLMVRDHAVVAVTSELYENGCEFGSITAETEELRPATIYLLRCAVPGTIPEEPDKVEKASRTTPVLAGLLIVSALLAGCEADPAVSAQERIEPLSLDTVEPVVADHRCQEELDEIADAWRLQVPFAGFRRTHEDPFGWRAVATEDMRPFFERGPGCAAAVYDLTIRELVNHAARSSFHAVDIRNMNDEELLLAATAVEDVICDTLYAQLQEWQRSKMKH